MTTCWEMDETLCFVLERRGFWDDRKTALWFWDGHHPLRYQRKISKKELRESSYAFASSLIKKFGVGRGEPIAIILPNIPEFAVVYFGILLSGFVAAPINPRLNRDEFSTIIKDAGIKTVVVLDKIYPEIADIETLENIIIVRMSESFPFLKSIIYTHKALKEKIFIGLPENDERAVDLKIFLKNGKKNHSVYFPRISKESNALMLFTSGTTGSPKGVIHTHKSLMENTFACTNLLYQILGRDNFKNEIFLAAAPYFHIMGISTMLHLPLLTGSKIIMTFPFPGEDFGGKLLAAINYGKVSAFVGAPRFYDMMLESFQKNGKWKWSDFLSLDACVSGSVEMPRRLQDKFINLLNKSILEGYGMSESGITHCQKPRLASCGSVGVPLSGVEHKILNPDESGRGEILVKSPGLMKGYLNTEQEEEIFIDENGWLHTADIGYINERNELFLVDRKRYIIKTKHGENIIPADIVSVLNLHELVKESAVLGKKGEDGYEEIIAYVVLKNKQDANYSYDALEKSLKEHCRFKLSSFKIPQKINFLEELPKNIFGKVLKKDLK